MPFKVIEKQCATCIYRRDGPFAKELKRLEDEIRDRRKPGHFKSWRICHGSKDACCAGFWARHKDDFDVGQVAVRLGLVEFVKEDLRENCLLNCDSCGSYMMEADIQVDANDNVVCKKCLTSCLEDPK